MSTAIPSLECSICSDLFEKPKILDCLHNFCEKCLQEYYDKCQAGSSTIPCPLCRQTVRLPGEGVRGLRTNFHLVSVIEEMEKMAFTGKTKTLCEMCTGDKTALHRCLDCERNVCRSCQENHERIPSCVGHTIVSLEDVRQGKVMVTHKTEHRCPTHEGEIMRFYCETCQQLICRDCTVLDHCKPDHKDVDFKMAAEKCKQYLHDAFPVLCAKINGHKGTLVGVAKAKQDFKNNLARAVKEVQETAAQVIAEFTAKVKVDEKRLVDEIQTLEQDRSRAFDEYAKTVNEALQRTQKSLETSRDVANSASNSGLLSLYPTIRNDLDALMTGPNIPVINRELSYLRMTRKYSLVGDIKLGELETVDNRKWELDVEFGNSIFTFVADVHFLSSGDIVVSDIEKQQVTTHSITGTQKSIIQMTTGPRRLAIMYNQILVRDETKSVKVYNKDGTLAFAFQTVEDDARNTAVTLRGLVVKKNTILVGDIERKVLTEHRPDGTLIRTIPVKTLPYFLAVDSNDRVVISGCDEVGVDVVDGNGSTLFSIKPAIKKQTLECTGVCCDGTDVYVALIAKDGVTSHIHQYNGEGKFLSCVIQGLDNPLGITFSADGKIAVADEKSVKIYHKA